MKKYLKLLFLFAAVGFAVNTADAQIGISVRIGPPALPVYEQPPCPVDGYLWQPGYWAYDDADGYYWVPGEWVAPPDPGLLWTPCYWGWDNGVYLFHAGYWGPHVGFYGGINYGFGYPGSGFYGGAWSGRSFRYNTAVFNVNRTVIHNTYVNRSYPHGESSRVSFNGGHGGINRQPDANERRFASERHVPATHTQMEHQQAAGHNPAQHFSANHGRPATTVNRGEEHGANGARPVGGEAHSAAAAHETRSPAAARPEAAHTSRAAAPATHNESRSMNNAPRAQQHVSQPEQHANRMPQQQHVSQPQQQPHMGGGGAPHGGPPAGGGGRPMGGGGAPHMGGGGPPAGGGGHGGGGGHHPPQ